MPTDNLNQSKIIQKCVMCKNFVKIFHDGKYLICIKIHSCKPKMNTAGKTQPGKLALQPESASSGPEWLTLELSSVAGEC